MKIKKILQGVNKEVYAFDSIGVLPSTSLKL